MKRMLIVSAVLLVVVLSICGCSQGTPVEREEIEEMEPVVESTVEDEPVAEEQAEEPATQESFEEAGPTEEEKALAAFLGMDRLPENMSDAEYEELVALMRTTQEMADFMQQTPSSAEDSAEKPAEVGSGSVQRSDAEVKEVINKFASNFKNTPAFYQLTDEAAEYLDKNLDILKNIPESDEALKTYMDWYRYGTFSEEEFLYAVESWIKVAGAYGSGTIVVQ